MDEIRKTGRVTIPTDLDVVPETLEILKKWGADAIRDCDGTDFPQQLKDADAKIYSTYYTTRKDNAWAKANPDEVQQCYIMTGFYTAPGDTVTIPLMKGIILNGALAYVSTHPKYKSRYYETGYPDDGYGVCTDVVAYALKNAGYDLQKLVDADIREQPQDYMVAEPDANIDFRRVRNLKVFFSHTAVALTTDVSEIEEWQGGDIVIFERHIGIVSDRRNKNGVPYIIHHNDPWQTAYEQDVLEKRTDIVGHYRISK